MVALGTTVLMPHHATETDVGLEEPSAKDKSSRHAQKKRFYVCYDWEISTQLMPIFRDAYPSSLR